MNPNNSRVFAQVNPSLNDALRHIEINNKPIDLDVVNLYLTSDPMLSEGVVDDSSVKVINKYGILARYKIVDDKTIFLYAEPTFPIPMTRAILTKPHGAYPIGTKVRIEREHSKASSLHDASFDVDVIDSRYPRKGLRVHRNELLVDQAAKNIYFCSRKTFESGMSFETALVPIARYEYYDSISKEQVADAWNMFYAVYPGRAPGSNIKTADEVILTYEHPHSQSPAHDTIRRYSLQDEVTRPVFYERYLKLVANNDMEVTNNEV